MIYMFITCMIGTNYYGSLGKTVTHDIYTRKSALVNSTTHLQLEPLKKLQI